MVGYGRAIGRLLASGVLIIVMMVPSACRKSGSVRGTSSRQGSAEQSVSGVWEKVGSPIDREGVTRSFSWGEAAVFPNSGLVFDVGAEKPFIQFWGELLLITAVRTDGAGGYEFDVRDEAITGSGAFVKVLFSWNPDGTATIDFQRRDGTFFGAATYERRYGPATN